jgi:hypothetical protein
MTRCMHTVPVRVRVLPIKSKDEDRSFSRERDKELNQLMTGKHTAPHAGTPENGRQQVSLVLYTYGGVCAPIKEYVRHLVERNERAYIIRTTIT